MSSFLITILVAAAGAYFAVFKTKQEKLWLERYEKTSGALLRANVITRFLLSEVHGEYQLHGLTQHEKQSLDANWPIARYELAQDIVRLQMLFTERDLNDVQSAWSALQTDLFFLLEESSEHDRPKYISKALPKSEWLERALIELAQRKCVENIFHAWARKLKTKPQKDRA